MLSNALLLTILFFAAAVHAAELQESDDFLAAITKAIQDGKPEQLEHLLQQVKDLPLLLSTEFNKGSLTPLQFAAKTNAATVPLLLRSGSDPLLAHSETGTLPLIFASRDGEMEATEALLAASKGRAGFHIDQPDSLGSSALNVVAITCNVAMAERLMQEGASVVRKDDAGNTALHVGAWYCNDEDSGGEKGGAFARALLAGLGDGEDVDVLGGTGRTALMLAAMRGATGYWDALIEAGASASRVGTNPDGKSAQELRAERAEL